MVSLVLPQETSSILQLSMPQASTCNDPNSYRRQEDAGEFPPTWNSNNGGDDDDEPDGKLTLSYLPMRSSRTNQADASAHQVGGWVL